MLIRNKIKPDYIAEINIPAATFISSCTKKLEHQCNLLTKTIKNEKEYYFSGKKVRFLDNIIFYIYWYLFSGKNNYDNPCFLSQAKEQSFWKSLFSNSFFQIEWSVQEQSNDRSLVMFKIGLSRWFESKLIQTIIRGAVRMMSLLLILTLLFYFLPFKEQFQDIFSKFEVIFLFLFAMYVLFLWFVYSKLSNSYNVNMNSLKGIINEILRENNCHMDGLIYDEYKIDYIQVLKSYSYVLIPLFPFLLFFGDILGIFDVLQILLPLILLFMGAIILYCKIKGLPEYSKLKLSCLVSNMSSVFLIIFFLYVTPVAFEYGLSSKNLMQRSSGANISRHNYERFSADNQPGPLEGDIHLKAITLYCGFGALIIIGILFFLYCRGDHLKLHGAANSIHQIDVKRSVRIAATDADRELLSISRGSKILIILIFIFSSVFCWFGVFINLSIICQLFFPNNNVLTIDIGSNIVEGTSVIAQSIAMNNSGFMFHLTHSLLTIPIIIPFLIFVSLHIVFFCDRIEKEKTYVQVKGKIDLCLRKIASYMGVADVTCYVDSSVNSFDIKANISGWPPLKRIILSHTMKEFLENCPSEYIEVVLAHEISHIKNDCPLFWKLRQFSRFGFVGAAYFSVLFDSISIEKCADEDARKYMKDQGINIKTFDEVLDAIMFIKPLYNSSNNSRCLSCRVYMKMNNFVEKYVPIYKNRLSRLLKVFYDTYNLYFNMLFYDYVHLEPQYRKSS